MKYIDISAHNGALNFEKVKSLYDGVMIRLSYGTDGAGQVYGVDKMADRSIRECHRLGIPFGLYHYSYAHDTAQAVSEAEGVIKLIDSYTSEGICPRLPIAFDMEDNKDIAGGDHGAATWAEKAEMCKAFCRTLYARKIYPVVYASRWWHQMMGDLGFDVWCAEWGVSKPTIPCTIWQYTSKGEGTAIGQPTNNLDLNISYVDYATEIPKGGYNGFAPQDVSAATPEPPTEVPTTAEGLYPVDAQGCFTIKLDGKEHRAQLCLKVIK